MRSRLHASVARAAAALLAGALVWASFPPLNWWPAGPSGVAVFTLVCRDLRLRSAAGYGWLTGAALFVPMLSFLRGLGVDAWLVPAAIEALWFAVLAVATRAVAGLRWWPAATATLWVGQEWLRDRWPFGGFPWGRLGFGQANGPLLPLAALGGAVLLTLATALLGTTLAWAVHQWRAGFPAVSWPRTGAATVGVGVLVVGGAVTIPLPTAGTSAHGRPAHAEVAVVQGNVPRLGLGEFAQRRAVTADHVAETEALAADVAAGRVPRPDVVIWPENASDVDPFDDPVARGMIDQAVAAIGVPVLVGAVLDGPGPHHVRNAAIAWSPTTGPGQVYVKRHLVPFGEYLPFRSVLGKLVGRFSLIPNDFVAGHRPGVLRLGDVRIADVICFEVADDGVVRDAVRDGGRLLAVQTNNATYERVGDSGHGGETAQQLEMARLRAVEHGRAVVVAATSGVSAIIAPDGRVLARSGVFHPALLVADLPLRDPRTVADRLGAWPERVVAALALLVLLAAGWASRRRPVRPVAPTTPPTPAAMAGRP